LDESSQKTFAIIGAGPIGGIMGAHLAKSGHNVILVDILKDHMDEIRDNGLSITGLKEMNVRFPENNLCYSIEDLAGTSTDAVFISVKASFLPKILPALRDVITPKTPVVSLQNGMDTEELIAEVFGKENSLRIVVNYAGNIVGNGKIRMSFFNAPNYIGMIDPSAEEPAMRLAEVITSADLETSLTQEIKKYEWEKVILNSALSSVCALTRKTMRQMMEAPETRKLVKAILVEGIEVAKACDVHYGSGFLDHCMDYLDNAGHHKTSMHVDVEKGSATEIDFLNGKIVEYGELKGVPTPHNSTILSLIKGIELPEHKE
jgi:2-dehydropantoate 2-reductase